MSPKLSKYTSGIGSLIPGWKKMNRRFEKSDTLPAIDESSAYFDPRFEESTFNKSWSSLDPKERGARYRAYLERLEKDARSFAIKNPQVAARSKNPLERYFAILQLIKDPVVKNIELIKSLTNDQRYPIRSLAINALVKLTLTHNIMEVNEIVDFVFEKFTLDNSNSLRLNLLLGIGAILKAKPEIRNELINKLFRIVINNNAHPFIMKNAIMLIGDYGTEKVVSSLLPFLKYLDKDVRGQTIQAIAKIDPLYSFKIAKDMLNDRSLIVRQNVIRAIGIIMQKIQKRPEIKEECIHILNSIAQNEKENEYIKKDALYLLKSLKRVN